jgi:lipid-binding SYLF domain-containing protein
MGRSVARLALVSMAVFVGSTLLIGGPARADTTPTDAQHTIAEAKRIDPGIAPMFRDAAGYVVFPSVGKGGFVVGGAHGDGIVYERGKPVGKAKMTQVSVGAQAGGQEYSEIIFFETPEALAKFKQSDYEFAAQTSAVALKSGASANAKYRNGVSVVTFGSGGLMLEAGVGGQKFHYETLPNPPK